MKYTLMAALFAVAAAPAAHAVDYRSAMETYMQDKVIPWASDAVILDAVKAKNAKTSGYDAAKIDALDLAWRAEIGGADTPTITPVLNSDAAQFLRDQMAASGGTMTEVFVMDAQGLNVAASDITSDYWQGDEAKHQMTYGVGPGAVHYGEIEFDESTQQYQAQISISLTDPDTGEVIGAMTIGVNADSLM